MLTSDEAESGARSAEGPSRDGKGGMEPEARGSNTRLCLVNPLEWDGLTPSALGVLVEIVEA
jgi:hypothetical protein